MVNVAYEFFLLIAAILQIPLMMFYGKTLMIPSCSLAFWWFFLCMNYFISDILWSSSDTSTWWLGYGYCDLVVRLSCGAHIGIICSIIAISKNLCRVITVSIPAEKFNCTKSRIIDVLISWVSPVLIMITSFIVQYQRYSILQSYGCLYQAANVKLTIVLVTIWTPIFASVAVAYTVAAFIMFLRRTKHMKVIFEAGNTGMTRSKYLKLLFYCGAVTVSILSLSLYITVSQARVLKSAQLWFSWPMVHDHHIWGIIRKISAHITVFEIEKSLIIVLAYLSFLSGGLTQEILAWYIDVLEFVGVMKLAEWISVKVLPTKTKPPTITDHDIYSGSDSYAMTNTLADCSFFTLSRKDSHGHAMVLTDDKKGVRVRSHILETPDSVDGDQDTTNHGTRRLSRLIIVSPESNPGSVEEDLS